MSTRHLRPDEKRAWARVARKVRPMPGVELPKPEPADTAARTAKPKRSAGPDVPVQEVTRSKPTRRSPEVADRSHERRVRRGQTDIAASLDLHGHTQATAHQTLTTFLHRQRQTGATCVLVITGKGKRGEGVLRQRFLQWLETGEARTLVSGYAPAHRKHGGGGAWYVFLRRTGA